MPEFSLREGIKKIVRAGYPAAGVLAAAAGFKVDRPVFIVGSGRCGTTLLVRILQSHPGLLGFPDEANNLWHPMMYPFKSARIKVRPIEFDPETFTRTSLASWPAGQERKIRNTFTGFNLIRGYRKKLFVKSAMVSFMLPQILNIFPTAQFIHIYRSGPSVVDSYFKRNIAKYPDVITDADQYRILCARNWNNCIMEIERVRGEYGLDKQGAYFELSYEELCANPESVMQRTAAYLGVSDDQFSYDMKQIRSTNYKVGDYSGNAAWSDCLQAMETAMKIKGYA